MGAGNAFGNTYIPGNWTNGGGDSAWGSNTEYEFSYTGDIGTVSIFLQNNTTYRFRMYDSGYSGGKWWSNSTVFSYSNPVNASTGDIQFYDNDGNHNFIKTTSAGYYTFTWNSTDCTLKVTYPTGITATFTNSKSWSSIKAYVWSGSGESATNKSLGAWSGSVVASATGSCSVTIDPTTEATCPDNIIWLTGNGGTGSQSADMPFGNYIYDYYGENNVSSITYSLTIKSYGWASLYLNYPALVPEGVTAYYASAASASTGIVTLVPISEGSTIPANTGVVVQGTANSSYNFVSTESAIAVSNLLEGKIMPVSISENSVYVLAGGETGYCTFKKYINSDDSDNGEGTVTLGANKAYLPISNIGAAADRIRFVIAEENNTTNFKNIDSEEPVRKFFKNGQLFILRNGVTYDTTGRIVK